MSDQPKPEYKAFRTILKGCASGACMRTHLEWADQGVLFWGAPLQYDPNSIIAGEAQGGLQVSR